MKAFREYAALAKAIEEAPSIPPCQTSDFELWFPEHDQACSKQFRKVREICKACPVQRECLTYALQANEQYGLWGGMTATERAQLKAKNRKDYKGRGRPVTSS